MHPADIQAALKKRDIRQKEIAAELGVSDMCVSKAINKVMISDRIMKAVAEKIGKDRRQVFPEYYLKPPKRRTSKVAAI